MIIDPPSVFAPVEEWQEFLTSLRAMEQTADVVEHIGYALRIIQDKLNA